MSGLIGLMTDEELRRHEFWDAFAMGFGLGAGVVTGIILIFSS